MVTVALWLTVGFRVGLQESEFCNYNCVISVNHLFLIIMFCPDTCDVNWQKNRDGIIISTLSISVVSLMVMALLIAVTYREQ